MGEIAGISVIATVRTQIRFGANHLMGAAYLSRQLFRIADANPETTDGFIAAEYLALATAVVMMATAAAEGIITERFSEAFDAATRTDIGDPKKAISAEMFAIWQAKPNRIDRLSLLSRADWFLEARKSPPLDPANPIVQNMEVLVALRNALVHFEPEWTNEEQAHRELSEALQDRFEPSPLQSGQILFPRAWPGPGCAAWAVETVRAFVELHSRAAGLSSPLLQEHKELYLPS